MTQPTSKLVTEFAVCQTTDMDTPATVKRPRETDAEPNSYDASSAKRARTKESGDEDGGKATLELDRDLDSEAAVSKVQGVSEASSHLGVCRAGLG